MGESERGEPGGYGFVAEYFDHVVPYRVREDLPFYVGAAVEAGGPVLELGCGTGRITLPTARAGVTVVGLERSRPMATVCMARLRSEAGRVRSRVRLLQGDMRAFHLDARFPLITAPFRSFQHLLGLDDQVACLACVHRHLEPGGQLVFDVFNPSMEALTSDDLGEVTREEPEFSMPDGRRVVRKHKVTKRDYFRQVVHLELIYEVAHPNGREARRVHPLSMRYFFRYELEHLLARCGFELQKVYSTFNKDPYGAEYPGELICTAQKRVA